MKSLNNEWMANDVLDVLEAIKSRRSIRAYTAKRFRMKKSGR